MLSALRKIIGILGKKWWLFLFLLIVTDTCFCVGSTLLDRDETTFISSLVHRYQAETGKDYVLFESFSSSGESLGYYYYSESPLAFERAADNSEYRTKTNFNTYFFLATAKNNSYSTQVQINQSHIGCNVFVPAAAKSHGSTFSFEQFGGSPIIFQNSLDDATETYISENIASSLLGEKVSDQNYQNAIGLSLQTSIDAGLSFSTIKKVAGIIKQSSLGIYETLLGENFLYSPISTASKHFQNLHMEFMLRNDWAENESVLRSVVFSNEPTRSQGEHKIYNTDVNGNFVLGSLNQRVSAFETASPADRLFPKILGYLFLFLGLCLLGLVTILEKRKGESVFPKRERDGRDIYNSFLFTKTIVLLVVLSAESLIRFALPTQDFFVPFGPLSMIMTFIFFLIQIVSMRLVFSHLQKIGWNDDSSYYDLSETIHANRSDAVFAVETDAIKI